MKKLDIVVLFVALFGMALLVLAMMFHATILWFVVLLGWIGITVLVLAAGILLIVWVGCGGLAFSWGLERLRQQRALTTREKLLTRRHVFELQRDKLQALIELQNSTQIMQVLKAGESLVTNQPSMNLLSGPVAPVISNGTGPAPMSAPIQVEERASKSYIQDPNWIRNCIFDEYGKLKFFHIKLDGPTGVGKTHLMLHLIWELQQPHPAAEYWLSDPKFEGESSGWPFTPFVKDFDDVAKGAQYMYDEVVTARKHAKRRGIAPKHPAFLIFDEADGCFDEHGEGFVKPLRRIIKEGRSGWAHCLLALCNI